MTPVLTPIDVDTSGEYDLVIAAAGFETRARFLAMKRRPKGHRCVAIGFSDRQELAFAENVKSFKDAGYLVEVVSDTQFGQFAESIFREAELHSQRSEMTVWIDISSFSRFRLAKLILVLRDLCVRRICRVHFMYNIAEYSDPSSDSLAVNTHAGPVIPEFAGWSASPDLPPIALVGLGYEEGKALGAVEYLQADEIWAFDPHSPIARYRTALDKANILLMELCPASRVIPYRIEDPISLFEKLETLVFAVKPMGRPHILPFGPKMFALVSLLVALLHPEAAVWRVSAGEAESAADRLPSDHIICLGMELNARDDLSTVDTNDSLLMVDRSRSQDVRQVVEDLKRGNRSEQPSHRRVYRPWGYYESMEAGEHFQVKRLMMKPGQALSLQLHRKRAEHWVVVSGRARVTRGEETLYLEENQSTFIPVGTKHRLENAGKEPLLIVEVQSGSDLGEDDIERFEDLYGRS